MPRWIKKSFVALFALFYALVFCELFTRFFDPQPLMPRYVTGSPSGIRMNIPGSNYHQHTPEVDVDIRINDQGFRADKNYSLKPAEGTCRIAIFGDSIFMGYEVDIHDSYASQLEEQLKKYGTSAEVINFSVSGFGTAENIINLEKNAIPFSPHIVLFEWHQSDFKDNIRSKLFKLKNGSLIPDAKSYLPAISTRDYLMKFAAYRWLIENSQFYSAIREKTAENVKKVLVWARSLNSLRLNSAHADTNNKSSKNDESDGDYEKELSLALLNDANTISHQHNMEFMVVDIPKRISRVEYISPLSWFGSYSSQFKFDFISPLNRFLRIGSPDTMLYYEKGQGHLTPLGNKILAEETAKHLFEKHYLNNCK